MSNPDPFGTYLRQLQKNLSTGAATEHTHRSALEALLEAAGDGVWAINEPRRVECGAPDFAVSRGDLTIGYVEAKDVGKSLDEAERSEQLQRYLRSLGNLVLTDYLEFRWYVDGERRRIARLAQVGKGGRFIRDRDGREAVISLLKDFLSHAPEPVATPKELAQRMARLTHLIRDIIVEAFEKDKASVLLRDLRKAFATALIPDLDQPEKTPEFADMYAQTIAYGLFAARCNHQGSEPFQRLGAAAEIPKTNPFLRKLFETITGTALDDEPYAGFVDDLVQFLGNADMEAILEHFGKRTRREDPVVHFYETFLATYDPKLRERRGVYYTPEPVVSYIARSVDYLLRTRFDLPEGLADTATVEYEREEDGKELRKVKATAPRVLILDPACGTGTFLYAVVDHIREQFMQRGDAGLWSGYVLQHLLPRLFGFELLMAPYAVAHFKLGMQLAGQDLSEAQRKIWAYDFSGEERLGIYLTNTLEEAERKVETLFGPLRVITEEANAAARVKRDLPIMVILGNPPYANFGRMNMGQWIMGLMQDWKPSGERKWNPDDFMKFMRWAQWRIEKTGQGVLAFITNHVYLDGITHRQMRQSLMETFNDIYVLDLHGSVRKKETAPDGSRDGNVFDILPGVAIGIFVKEPGKSGPAALHHAELWGPREYKYARLLATDVATTSWTQLVDVGRQSCLGAFYFFAPKAFDNIDEYCEGWSVQDIFPVHQNGLKTDRDSLFFGFDHKALENRIKTFYSEAGMAPAFREAYRIKDSSSYDLLSRRLKTSFDSSNIHQCLYRPFDWRWLYYTPGLTSRPAWGVMRHMLADKNVGLICLRQTRRDETGTFLVGRGLINKDAVSLFDIATVFPLYLYPADEGGKGQQKRLFDTSPWPPGKDWHVPNLAPQFVAELEKWLSLKFVPDGASDMEAIFGPEDVFHYIYAIFHSPTYRTRYAEFLKIDFPRVPLISDRDLFHKLCALGTELVALHLLESPTMSQFITRYPVPGDDWVERGYPKYLTPGEPEPGIGKPLEQGRVYINKTQYFEGIEPDVWEFQIGGYQVLHKWLKDRKGRKLTFDDLFHYQKIVVALKQTMRLMEEIDDLIPSWPIE